MISAQKITTLFLNYFTEKGHIHIPSSSLIPREDEKSLLYVNAGMVPFKRQFSGYEPIAHMNVTSVQRCLRAGGKHNDLENVGYTTRHHTFFEMLGNFSFGGYFKREAIQYAWDFLTQVLKLPTEKLWITVHQDDKESADIWLKELKVDSTRFSYCGDSDNFWSMGEVGPCGPCSEIFYDHGPKVQGGPPGSSDAEGDRYVEIWNLVFMQYDRKADGTLLLLPKPCVDTGMGLERLTAVMQGVVSNYDTDIFQVLMKATAKQAFKGHALSSHTLKVIADHIRAIAFLITDGMTPNNEGRGYVLRRIIRRALRHGYQSGIKEPFLYGLVPILVDQMKTVYPELSLAQSRIIQSLLDEEEQFLHTLHHGLQYFEKSLSHLNGKTLSGRLVFKLYDTYGFPADLTAELARERGLLWDETGFKVEMDRQKKRSQLAGISSHSAEVGIDLPSVFKGYKDLQQASHIIGLLNKDHQPVQQLLKGDRGSVILGETPFYAESGGQVGDQGKLWIGTDSSVSSHFVVSDTQKINTTYLHKGYVTEGRLKVGDRIHSQVDSQRRQAIKRHHSVTHLLHAALREQLGANVTQKGSLVAPDYLRFDFHYRPALTSQEVQRIEYRVNQAIWDNLPVKTQLMSLENAKKKNIISLFEQKYGEEVRVLSMGNFSHELCGGTHVDNTGEIGYFTITLVTSIASGIKRIEAVAGEAAFEWIQELKERQNTLTSLFKTNPEHLYARVEKQMALVKSQASDISELQQYLCRSVARSLSKRVIQVGDMTLVVAMIPTLFMDRVREVVDQIKSYLPKSAVVVLGCQRSEDIQISIGVSKQYTHRVSAKDMIAWLMPLIEGKGGGRPDFSQMQAKGNKQTLRVALKEIRSWLIQSYEKTDV